MKVRLYGVALAGRVCRMVHDGPFLFVPLPLQAPALVGLPVMF